jgi:NAD(P)-dependent dehydrogenase (short-subunit alcohol dehydrogenase family)
MWVSDAERAFALAAGARIEVTAAASLAEPLAAALRSHGYNASVVAVPSGKADAVIITEGLTAGEAAARHWAALQGAKAARRDGAVTVLLQAASPTSGLDGLSRTLRKEWPESTCVAWTLSGTEPAAIIHALASGYGDGLLTEHQSLQHAEPGAPVFPAPALQAHHPSVWLVTGGARGVTASCAIELARQAGGTILLAGRSAETPWPAGLPEANDLKSLRGLLVARSRMTGERVTPAEIDRTARNLLAGAEIRATLAAIREAGAIAEYVPLDAGDAVAVAHTISDVQARHGRIGGWVHGAGVLADKLAMDKTEVELRRVFAPKVGGLENILGALDPVQLSHVGLFSSAAAFFGNRGQSDYAMANALLASAGRNLARATPGAQVKVFHWGPWAGGMVDDTLASHFEAQGIPLIPVDEGARIFATELLGGNRDQVELIVGEAWATA